MGSKLEALRREVARAIGELAMEWATLEHHVDIVLTVTIPIPSEVHQAVLGHMDLRDKLQVLRSVGYLRRPSDDWFSRLEAALNAIDNDLRPKRNRYVHDMWFEDQDRMLKVQKGPKIMKPAARARELRLTHREHVPLSEIEATVSQVIGAGDDLIFLMLERQEHERLSASPETPPSPRPPRKKSA